MRIGVAKNKKKIFLYALSQNTEIHPLWLRERITNSNYLDKNNGQRLYEPSNIKKNLKIKSALIKNRYLNVKFNDGVETKFIIQDLINEINTKNKIKGNTIKKTKGNKLISNKECDQNTGKTLGALAGGLFGSSRFKSKRGKIAGAATGAIIGAGAGSTIDGC